LKLKQFFIKEFFIHSYSNQLEEKEFNNTWTPDRPNNKNNRRKQNMGDNSDLIDPTMSGMMNFEEKDAFAEADQAAGAGTGNKVHIRVQQRNRRKCVLTIQGLDDDLDLKKICKALRKNLQCNGAIVKDKEFGDVIQLQGDHRSKVAQFLCDQEIIRKDQLIIHGSSF